MTPSKSNSIDDIDLILAELQGQMVNVPATITAKASIEEYISERVIKELEQFNFHIPGTPKMVLAKLYTHKLLRVKELSASVGTPSSKRTSDVSQASSEAELESGKSDE